jgi:hypothetical protein
MHLADLGLKSGLYPVEQIFVCIFNRFISKDPRNTQDNDLRACLLECLARENRLFGKSSTYEVHLTHDVHML